MPTTPTPENQPPAQTKAAALAKKLSELTATSPEEADIIIDARAELERLAGVERECGMLRELVGARLEAEVAALREDKARLDSALLSAREHLDEFSTAEDRSNLDGDSAEVVLEQINTAAEQAVAAIDLARANQG